MLDEAGAAAAIALGGAADDSRAGPNIACGRGADPLHQKDGALLPRVLGDETRRRALARAANNDRLIAAGPEIAFARWVMGDCRPDNSARPLSNTRGDGRPTAPPARCNSRWSQKSEDFMGERLRSVANVPPLCGNDNDSAGGEGRTLFSLFCALCPPGAFAASSRLLIGSHGFTIKQSAKPRLTFNGVETSDSIRRGKHGIQGMLKSPAPTPYAVRCWSTTSLVAVCSEWRERTSPKKERGREGCCSRLFVTFNWNTICLADLPHLISVRA